MVTLWPVKLVSSHHTRREIALVLLEDTIVHNVVIDLKIPKHLQLMKQLCTFQISKPQSFNIGWDSNSQPFDL